MLDCPCPSYSREEAARFEAVLRALENEFGVRDSRAARMAAHRGALRTLMRRLRLGYTLLRRRVGSVTLSGKLHDEDEGGPLGRGGS